MSAAGTYAWMAPEVIRTNTFSKASDVWRWVSLNVNFCNFWQKYSCTSKGRLKFNSTVILSKSQSSVLVAFDNLHVAVQIWKLWTLRFDLNIIIHSSTACQSYKDNGSHKDLINRVYIYLILLVTQNFDSVFSHYSTLPISTVAGFQRCFKFLEHFKCREQHVVVLMDTKTFIQYACCQHVVSNKVVPSKWSALKDANTFIFFP